MSATSIPGRGSGIDNGKSPKTPGGRKLVQGRLPFAAVDNKASSPKISNETKPKEEEIKTPAKMPSLASKDKQNEDEELVCLDDSIKSLPAESDESVDSNHSPMDASGLEGSELDASNTSMNTSSNATPRVTRKKTQNATPKGSNPDLSASKTAEREKKRLEKLKEKEEKEKKRLMEKAERERLKKEKEEEKETEKRRKEEEKRKKEEEREAEKKKREEEREAEKKRREEEKKRKEEEKEAEKKKKEEEKRRKEEEKEAEKKKKEEEERKKKERVSQVFTNFFTQKKTTPAKGDQSQAADTSITLAFPPFRVKENMRLAPTVRSHFDSVRRVMLDHTLEFSDQPPEVSCQQFKGQARKSGPTWPLNKDSDVEIIDEDDAPVVNKDDVIITVPSIPRRMRAKLLKFTENRRPAYWGTWRKTSQTVGPRRPFGKEPIMDYEVDSDDEWEEEVEPGESLEDSEGEGDEKEPADDYEVDNEFLVPHGYLSDEEGEKDEDERPLSPTAAKEQLKLKEEQFERELKEKTCHIKPSLIGCCWEEQEQEEQLLKVLRRYGAVFISAVPVILQQSQLMCDSGGGSPTVDEAAIKSEKVASKRLVGEADMPVLIRILHGTSYSKAIIVNEFLAHLERTRPEDKNAPSKLQIVAKIAEIASWSKCSEVGAMNGRTCWLVQPEVLERYNMADVTAVNTWEFSNESKKRGRKTDDSANKAEEESTPPAKAARVSLLKKFATPASPASPSAPPSNPTPKANESKEGEDSEPSTPKTKKRVALISVPTSASKKSKTEAPNKKLTPMTTFLKKMSTPKAQNTPPPKPSPAGDPNAEAECIELDDD